VALYLYIFWQRCSGARALAAISYAGARMQKRTGVHGRRISFDMDFVDYYIHWVLHKSLATMTISLWTKFGGAFREHKWCVRRPK
jgi:hypothetical protein